MKNSVLDPQGYSHQYLLYVNEKGERGTKRERGGGTED